MNSSSFEIRRSGMSQSRKDRRSSGTVRVFGRSKDASGGEGEVRVRIERVPTENAQGRGRQGDRRQSDRRQSEERARGAQKHPKKRFAREAVGSRSRAAAALAVNAVSEGVSLNEAFSLHCKDLDARDTGFVKEIVYGTLRHRRLLMHTLLPMFERKITERHRIVQSLLLTALYQIVFMRSPVHAVVSATVSACGECGHKSFTSMVNAILRRFLREGAQLAHSDNPCVEHSFPDWLHQRLLKDYGEEIALKIMRESNRKADMFLRVETSRIGVKDYLSLAASANAEFSLPAPDLAPSCVLPDHALNIDEIPGFLDGLCSVQDLSAQLAAPLLELEKDSAFAVLDCCCAPGGKTAHILDLAPKSRVTALDCEKSRLDQAKGTLSRLGRKADLRIADACDLDGFGMFDRILLDAPCSGTGVIRRHPDIKWLRRDKDIAALCETQRKIMDAAFSRLKPDGIMVYTTCSVLQDENARQVELFLRRHPDAALRPFVMNGKTFETRQVLPGEDGGDGFFYAVFVKKGA